MLACGQAAQSVKNDNVSARACAASPLSRALSSYSTSMSPSASHSPLVDGTTLLSSVTSVPTWCQAFFTRDRYRRLAVGGVLDLSKRPQPGDTSESQHEGRECPSSPVSQGREEECLSPEGVSGTQFRDIGVTDSQKASSLCHAASSNAPDTSSLSSVCTASSVDDGRRGKKAEENYGHLLHDLLRAYGGVKDLQYFVSEERGSNESSFPEGTQEKSAVSPTQFPSALKISRDASSDGETVSPSGSRIPQMLVLCHVGKNVCGHKGVAHGGFIATILDNSLGYASHFIFSRAATKNLEVKFIRPLLADSLILVDVSVESVDYAAGACTVLGKIYALKPGVQPEHSSSRMESKRDDNKESGSGPVAETAPRGTTAFLPPGVWVVAAGKAVMVDVTEKWKDIK